jgi:hypothetical protein
MRRARAAVTPMALLARFRMNFHELHGVKLRMKFTRSFMVEP